MSCMFTYVGFRAENVYCSSGLSVWSTCDFSSFLLKRAVMLASCLLVRMSAYEFIQKLKIMPMFQFLVNMNTLEVILL